MSSTAMMDEGYDDLEDDGGLSGFWILSIFLIVLCVFSAIVYFAYQRGLSDRAATDGVPTVVADPRPVRQEIAVEPETGTREEVFDELNGTPTTIAQVDPAEDPLENYDETTTGAVTTDQTDPFLQALNDTGAETADTAPEATTNTPPIPTVAPQRPAVESRPTVTQPTQTTSAPAAGTWAVQVGAFGSNDEAMNNYRRLSDRYGNLVSTQTPDVNVATVNGTTYHRLWLGEFGTRAEAQAHCDKLKAAGQDCLARQR